MVKLVNGKRGNWGTYSIFKLFKNVKKIRNAYTGCQELFMRGFLVTVKSLLTREKSFFFLAALPVVTSACDRHRTIQQQARKKSLVPRVSKLCNLQKQARDD